LCWCRRRRQSCGELTAADQLFSTSPSFASSHGGGELNLDKASRPNSELEKMGAGKAEVD
jgi:hypothetical protein